MDTVDPKRVGGFETAEAAGRVDPRSRSRGLMPLILAAATMVVGPAPADAAEGAAPAPKVEGPTPAPAPPVGEAKPATCDATCVRASAERASQVCAPRIENEAPFDFEWLTRPYGGIFQEADPPATGGVIVRYKGDSIRFMSPQREWVRITYECSFNASTQRVEGVVVRLGRLNGRGLPPAAANNAGRVAATAPQQPGSPANPSGPPAKRKPRPGEPSSIEILQVNPTGR